MPNRTQQGTLAVPELCREHSISNAMFYKWRAKFGGMDASLMARMKELEDEKRRLKKRYAEERLERRNRRAGPDKKVVMPSQRREMAQWAVAQRSATIGLACQAFGISQTCYRYRAKLDAENAVVADWQVRLSNNQRKWGFGLCLLYLHNVKGFKWNHKRVINSAQATSDDSTQPNSTAATTRPNCGAV